MTLYEQWRGMADMATTREAQLAFWNEYFAAETENYKKILENKETVFTGKLTELAAQFDMTAPVFCGFMDGINESLVESYEVEKLEEETEIALKVDFEKLFYNMLDAKAKWLYTLPQWDDVLPEETRQNMTREWRRSQQAVSEKVVGRNDPCPCGSGKKYKKCCGAGK
ncbi:MAG: SEC-C domain-containing protein [Christensenellaceae bacterium]|nr:SEC-C domain-containing protein [Christensenellaceae bacterium]